ncbi:MAG: septum formation initiator family protein [Thermoleophilaceae bacterium]|nr:septum formation initiator family protein [Thermoleophilaceae bacterium]
MASITQARIRPTGGSRGAPGRIRWDRVGRYALLATLLAILALYISPARSYITQRGTAADHHAEVVTLEKENARLKARERELRNPRTLEQAARRLGMVEQGERAYVIENLRR